MKPLNTSTLYFRALKHSDIPTLYSQAFSVHKVTKYLQWKTHQNNIETKKMVEDMILLHQKKNKYFWIAVSVEENRAVGLCSIKPDEKTAWVGLLVFHQEQRKGFGSTILSSLENLVLTKFDYASATVDSANQSSISLLQKRNWIEWYCESVKPLKAYKKTLLPQR